MLPIIVFCDFGKAELDSRVGPLLVPHSRITNRRAGKIMRGRMMGEIILPAIILPSDCMRTVSYCPFHNQATLSSGTLWFMVFPAGEDMKPEC